MSASLTKNLKTKSLAFIDYWLPADLKSLQSNSPSQVSEYFKSRMLVIIGFVTPLLAPGNVSQAAKWGCSQSTVIADAATVVLGFFSLPVLKYTKSRTAGATVFLSAFALNIAIVLWKTGGLDSPGLAMLFFMPVLGTFIVSPKSGLFWAGIAAITAVGMSLCAQFGVLPPSEILPQFLTEARLSMFMATMGATFVIYFSERLRESLQSQLTASYVQLENSQTLNINSARSSAMRSLAAGFAHEINNPLAIVTTGLTSLKMKETFISEEYKRRFSRILVAAQRMSEIVSKILIFTTSTEQDPIEKFEIKTFLEDSIQFFSKRPECASHPIKISPLHPESPSEGEVTGQPNQLSSAIFNVLLNAAEFSSKPTSEIRILYGLENGKAIIKVEDDGKGVEKNIKEHLFEPFVSSYELVPGRGLGLAMARSILKRNGGDIWLESDHLPTRFVMEFGTQHPS